MLHRGGYHHAFPGKLGFQATAGPCTQCIGSVIRESECVSCCRPVDCYTKVPLDYLPGYINETIYGDNIESGWAWYPFPAAPAANAVNNKQLQVNATDNMHRMCAFVHAS